MKSDKPSGRGEDLRDEKLSDRKRHLARLLARADSAIRFNDHLEHDGPVVFEHACRMGLEGIVSKRLDAPEAAFETQRRPYPQVFPKYRNPEQPRRDLVRQREKTSMSRRAA